MKRFVALMAAVGLCMAFSMGCKKMTAPADTPEDKPEAAAETTSPPPPPPPPATPAEPAQPEEAEQSE